MKVGNALPRMTFLVFLGLCFSEPFALGGAPALSPGASPQATAPKSDAELETDVKDALAASDALKGETITAQVAKGKVTLSGTVSSAAAKNQAQLTAASVTGVTKVVNNLKVAKTQKTPKDNQAGTNKTPAPGSKPGTPGKPKTGTQSITVSLPTAYANVPYDVQLVVDCEPDCPTWSLAQDANSARPDEKAAQTGRIEFTPSFAGTSSVQLTGTDTNKNSWTVDADIAVNNLVVTVEPEDKPFELPPVVKDDPEFNIDLPTNCGDWKIDKTNTPEGFLEISNAQLKFSPEDATSDTYKFSAICTSGAKTTTAFFQMKAYATPPLILATSAPANSKKKANCDNEYNDCDWQYWVSGGGEESALSSQDSSTNAFVTFFTRVPVEGGPMSVWLLARFLGAPNANNTNNVVSAFKTATGTSSTSGLPQVGTAVDYVFGFEADWLHNSLRRFTAGPIAAVGATTPLSAQHTTAAFQAPTFGSNECDELYSKDRFGPGAPVELPARTSPYPYIVTTTTPSSGSPSKTTTGPFCIINPVTTTVTSNGTTTMTQGIQQKDIAFAPEDRSSFLIKYMAGMRLINRWHSKDGSTCGLTPTAANPKGDFAPCVRSIADLTLGQDEAITGGILRHAVFKGDVIFAIPKTTAFFFGSAAMRIAENKNLSPLILQPATVVTTSQNPPSTTQVPSPNTWVLPLTQPDRDFYRVGIGVDLSSTLATVFKGKS